MIFQRLTRLFARYSGQHLRAAGQPMELWGEDGQSVGYIDRITLFDQHIEIEGWAVCKQLYATHAGRRTDGAVTLARPDVNAAIPQLAVENPGFSLRLARGGGPVVLTLLQGNSRLIYHLGLPDNRALRLARVRLLLPFLRDLTVAMPAVLTWFATKNLTARQRVKHCLGLDLAAPSKALPPSMFLADHLAQMPAHRHAAELARLYPAALENSAITVVLPIYNALDLLPEVLDRVLRNTDLQWRLILIEDASTDPALRPFLRSWVAEQKAVYPDQITLIEHAENQGFIRSVNAGLRLALSYGDHVVLLNSDAFVPKAWASRLMRPFWTHDNVASVTPMSNDAEIFSAPIICQRGPLSPGQSDAIDAVAAKIHPDAALANAPTGVGFCMAMSIDFLRHIPELDTSFGRGYGEEVDWCQKARALGGRHLGLANVFVEHRGGASFGSAEKRKLVARNNAVISQRYPAYDADVQDFVADDPLAACRLALAIAWAATKATGPVPLYLAHSLGGGAEDYLAQRIARAQPNPALVLRVGSALRWRLELHCASGILLGSTDDFALIQRMLASVQRLKIVYSCGVGDPDPVQLPDRLLALHRGPEDQIDVLIHDYFPISPAYTLLNAQGRHLGAPNPNSRDIVHCARGSDGGIHTLAEWQAAWGKLFAAATDVSVFSKSSATIMAKAYPEVQGKLRLVPHKMLIELPALRRPLKGRPVVIGVLGNIGHHKGAGVLQDLSHRLGQTGQAKLVILGRFDPFYTLAASAHLHGGYDRCDIPALAMKYGITDWLIPSIWPETFSYTTHEAIATGLPVWSFDLGAQADAIRGRRQGGVIPIPGGVPDLDTLLLRLLTRQTESAAA